MSVKKVVLLSALIPLVLSFFTDYQQLNVAIFLVFLVFLLLGVVRTLYRVYEYKRDREELPDILIRDAISRTGLGVSFLMILLVRALGWGPLVANQEWWSILTTEGAIIGTAVYAYFEFFIINKKTLKKEGR